MSSIRKHAPFQLVIHPPKTPQAQAALARQVAQIHADAVIDHLKNLSCTDKQKLELLDHVIAHAGKSSGQ